MPPVSPPATLHYEPPKTNPAVEISAVWRVAWWIGVLWSIGTILATSQTAWTLVSGGWAESRRAELRFGALTAGLDVVNLVGAIALVGALWASARRRLVAILATAMSVLLMLSVVAGIMRGGVYYEKSFHLVWLGAVVLRMLLNGGIVVVVMVAWWPAWMTPARLVAAVAILLLGSSLAQLLDLLYWWLARGEPMGQVLRGQFSWQDWPSTLQAALLLLVSMLLLVMSPAMRRRRWLLRIAVFAAVLGIVFYDLLYLYRAFDVFWTNEPLSQLLSMFARDLQQSAPVLGLLVWRPQRPPSRPT